MNLVEAGPISVPVFLGEYDCVSTIKIQYQILPANTRCRVIERLGSGPSLFYFHNFLAAALASLWCVL